MQRYSFRIPYCSLLFTATLAFFFLLAGCGGSSSNTVTTLMIFDINDTAFATPLTTLSLTFGDTHAFTTRAMNSKGVVLAPTITWTTSNNMIADVDPSGEVCAGHWHDQTFVVCDPAQTAGTATVTATGGGMSASLAVSVHPLITSVTVTPATNPVCTSQTKTLQYTATAFAGTTDITQFAGPPTYASSAAAVATVDGTGLVTSLLPGATQISAAFAGVTSQPATFVACPPATITLHLSGDPTGTLTTNFNLNVGDTKTLAADVVDTLGAPITGTPLTFSSAAPASAMVSSAGTLTAPGAGFATIVASCSPFINAEGSEVECNSSNGTNAPGTGIPIYSNLVTVTVAGASSTSVYVTGAIAADGTSTNTMLIPIPTATNTPGTAIVLPGVPNSMMFAPNGSAIYIGTSTGLAVVNPSTNTVTSQLTNVLGTVIAVSPDGDKVVLNDPPNNRVTIFDTVATSNNVTPIINVPGVTAAAFSADSYKLFLAGPGKVYEFVNLQSTRNTPTGGGALTSVAPIPQGVLAYASPASANTIASIATCNNALITNPTVGNAPALLQAAPNGSRLVGVGPDWNDIPYTVSSMACPPAVSEAPTSFTYSGAAPAQLVLTSDSKYAFVTGEGATAVTALSFYNIATTTPGTAPIANGGGVLTSGGVTNDGLQLYVGVTASGTGTANALHRFDLTQPAPTDATQVPIGFPPQFVAVQPK